MATNRDLFIDQGRTFRYVVRWEVLPIVYKPITNIVDAPSPLITAVGHGMPDGWRVALSGIRGTTQLNAPSNPPKDREYAPVTVKGVDAFELNQINAVSAGLYTSGGFIQYFTPQDLTGYTARAQVRDRVGGALFQSLTSAAGQIVIDNINKAITLVFVPADTLTAAWSSGVYDLVLTAPDGTATTLLSGAITLNPQVTI